MTRSGFLVIDDYAPSLPKPYLVKIYRIDGKEEIMISSNYFSTKEEQNNFINGILTMFNNKKINEEKPIID